MADGDKQPGSNPEPPGHDVPAGHDVPPEQTVAFRALGRPDETAGFDPFVDDPDDDDLLMDVDRPDGGNGPTAPGDATTVLPPVPTGPAGTSVLPRLGASQPGGPDPAGAAGAAAAGVAGADASPKWTARARVPTPGVDDEPVVVEEEWAVGDRPGSGLLRPVLISLAVLLLLGVVGVGVWMMLRGAEVTPAPGGGTDATSAPATRTAPATSRAPRTTAAQTSAAPQPESVTVPPLRGRSRADAEVILRDRGLTAQVLERANADVPAGRVISTEPGAGTRLERGATVQVIVSSGTPNEPPRTEAPEPTGPATTAPPTPASP